MRARTLLGLVGGIAVLSWPALGRACDPGMTESEANALGVWLLSMAGILGSLMIAAVSRFAARPRTRAKIYRVLGMLNLIAWVCTLVAFHKELSHPQVWPVLSPSLVVGCGLWLVGSRGSRPRIGVTPGPM